MRSWVLPVSVQGWLALAGPTADPRGLSSGIIYALATGGSIGVYTLADATGVRAVHDPFAYVRWFFIVYGAAILVVAPAARGHAVLLSAPRQVSMAPLFGVLAIASLWGALLAYRLGATARLAALRETSVLFGTTLAVIFLRERVGLRRWLAAALITFGATVLASA